MFLYVNKQIIYTHLNKSWLIFIHLWSNKKMSIHNHRTVGDCSKEMEIIILHINRGANQDEIALKLLLFISIFSLNLKDSIGYPHDILAYGTFFGCESSPPV